LGRRFGLVFVPFHSFQHLLTNDQQRRSLEAIGRHLEPTGRLALHLFDPPFDLLIATKTERKVILGDKRRPGQYPPIGRLPGFETPPLQVSCAQKSGLSALGM
jgi:hypothetical protein